MHVLLHVVALAADLTNWAPAGALHAFANQPSSVPDAVTLVDAQRSFYNGQYNRAAEQTLALREADPEDLAACELRTSALLFQLKEVLGEERDKQKALRECSGCAQWIAAFLDDTARGRSLARKRLGVNGRDEAALFFLGKIDLNYLWLQLGLLGRRKGWDEYWEARRSLDMVIAANPEHVRARVARAWIDYIVDTRLPRGTRWLLGGGNRKRALSALREASSSPADFFSRVEAEFSLWDMLVRERNIAEAVSVARKLSGDFPDNHELTAFLAAHDRAP